MYNFDSQLYILGCWQEDEDENADLVSGFFACTFNGLIFGGHKPRLQKHKQFLCVFLFA